MCVYMSSETPRYALEGLIQDHNSNLQSIFHWRGTDYVDLQL